MHVLIMTRFSVVLKTRISTDVTKIPVFSLKQTVPSWGNTEHEKIRLICSLRDLKIQLVEEEIL